MWKLGSHRGQGKVDVQKRFHVATRVMLARELSSDLTMEMFKCNKTKEIDCYALNFHGP